MTRCYVDITPIIPKIKEMKNREKNVALEMKSQSYKRKDGWFLFCFGSMMAKKHIMKEKDAEKT